MLNVADLERCSTFVNCHVRPTTQLNLERSTQTLRAITVSREAGCGAAVVARKLEEILQSRSPHEACPCTMFDRNLIGKVLADHRLPAWMAKHLPEDRISRLEDITYELFGLRPACSMVIQQTSETILRLAELGNVILIGRGANVITAKLPGMFHVRLVAPLEKRIEHVHDFYNMSAPEARSFCLREDRGRRRYLKKYFDADIDNPLLYHLVINTGLVTFVDAAQLIADTALRECA